MATVRQPTRFEPVDLNYPNTILRVPTLQGVAARVSLAIVGGSIGSAVLSVRITRAGVVVDFGTPVTLSSGTLSAVVDADDMRGVDELVLEVTTAAGAASFARIEVVQDEDK